MSEERYGIRVWIAYAVVSVVWGSTYLAIRVGVLELPPFWMGGIRLVTAGTILLAIALLTGRRLPRDAASWGWLVLTGILILGVALGSMFWAEQHLESGLAALVACVSPLLMALYGSIGPRGDRLTARIMAGLLIGLAGVAILVDPAWARTGGAAPFIAVGVIIASSNAWSGGSVLAKRKLEKVGPLVSSAIHSLVGGVFLLLLDLILRGGSIPAASGRAWAALAYLTVFGSVIAYSAYVYLVRHMEPARAGTFTYINPVIAVLLGALLLGEAITWRVLLGGAVILAGLVLVRRSKLVPRADALLKEPAA